MIEALLKDLFNVAILMAVILAMCLVFIPVFSETKKREE